MRNRPKAILLTGLIAGTLDMSTALLVYSVILKKVTAARLVQGIASGVFGADAYEGGFVMIIFGFLFHYCIALTFTFFYYLIYPRVSLLKKNWLISGLLYGLFAWAIMNLVVLEIVFPARAAITFESFAIGASILMVMIGVTISFFTHRYYSLRFK